MATTDPSFPPLSENEQEERQGKTLICNGDSCTAVPTREVTPQEISQRPLETNDAAEGRRESTKQGPTKKKAKRKPSAEAKREVKDKKRKADREDEHDEKIAAVKEEDSETRSGYGGDSRPTPSAQWRSGATGSAAALSWEWESSDGTSPLLILFLRLNTTGPRIDQSAWDFLTLKDLTQLRILSKSLRRDLDKVEYRKCRDGNDYLVPFPGYPGVLSTPHDREVGAGLYPHQLASLQAMYKAENRSTAFGALRGGILGDAPGLGKTITLLALLASTAGMRTIEPTEFWDEDAVAEGWKLLRSNAARKEDILKALAAIRRWVQKYGTNDVRQVFKDVERYVSPPYRDDRFPTIASFERYVRQKLKHVIPVTELELFRKKVCQMKADLDKRNRSFYKSVLGDRIAWERDLIPSSSTLVIVPDALLEHWAEQMRRHLDLSIFADPNEQEDVNDEDGGHKKTDSLGVCWIDGVGDLSEARFPLQPVSLNQAMQPVLHLIKHLVVVVTFSRCLGANGKGQKIGRGIGQGSRESSPLLQARWLRVVVDEGHELGQHSTAAGLTNFINTIAAERRWVLSGTPTTGDVDSKDFTSKGLDQLQRLLLFLRHPVYGTAPPKEPTGPRESIYVEYSTSSESESDDLSSEASTADESAEEDGTSGLRLQAKKSWNLTVKGPFLAGKGSALQELRRILNENFVMHRKEDVSLPKPIFKQGETNVPLPDDVQNLIVEASVSNKKDVPYFAKVLRRMGKDVTLGGKKDVAKLKTALKGSGHDMADVLMDSYLGSTDFQSLVDEAQAKYIIQTLQRERRIVTAQERSLTRSAICNEDLDEKINPVSPRPVKAVVYSSSNKDLLSVVEHLYRNLDPENIAEMYGGIGELSSELSRFRNGYKEGRKCPICGGWNDLGHASSNRCSRILLQVMDSDKRRFLVEPERIRRAVNRGDTRDGLRGNVEQSRLGGESLTKYGELGNRKHWRVGDVFEIDVREPHPVLQSRWDDDKWKEFGADKFMDHHHDDDDDDDDDEGYEGNDWYFGQLPHYDQGQDRVAVELVKFQRCSAFHSRSWYEGPTLANVAPEKVKEDVFVLGLFSEQCTGLDLSFVTHIFLLEPIEDAATLEQVTSRAHRLGATGPVVVETVNVWRQITSDTLEAMINSSVGDEKAKQKKKVVCEYCFRSFDSMEKAETHEQTCERNPNGTAIADPFHLVSVYRDIRPPLPLKVGQED